MEDQRKPRTPEEEAEYEAYMQRVIAAIKAGKSQCCDAPLDVSQVIGSGRHKGHGPRFCSACRKIAFMV